MERHKRIRLVLDNIDEVVGYLEKLKEAIRPEFHKREFTVYEVGVDIIQMCGSDEIEYLVRVHGDENLMASQVEDAVLTAVPDYQGRSGVISATFPYPADGLLNLEFLRDMRDARR